MLKKDENTNRLQNDLQDSRRELNGTKGVLCKVKEERNRMWEEVKDYNEKNMLLTSEVDTLKKKINNLDEDILIKEGELEILKDYIRKKSFDCLANPNFARDFQLE